MRSCSQNLFKVPGFRWRVTIQRKLNKLTHGGLNNCDIRCECLMNESLTLELGILGRTKTVSSAPDTTRAILNTNI